MTDRALFYKNYLVHRVDRQSFTPEDFNYLLPILNDDPETNKTLPLYLRRGFQAIQLSGRAELDRLYELNDLHNHGLMLSEWAEVAVKAKVEKA